MPDPTTALRRAAYLLIGTVAVFIVAGKIVGGENVFEPSRYAPAEGNFDFNRPDKPTRKWPTARPEPSPFYSSNDKSRWATIRALVEEGTYVVGRRENFRDAEGPFRDTGIIFEPEYQSLDKVMNPDTGEFYSSKPPLFATALAGEYWLLKKVFDWDIERDRWPVTCTILLTVNVMPFALYLWVMAVLIDRLGRTDFGRLFAFTLAACGTFLIPFGMTLNNHSPATYCVAFALYPLLRKGTLGGSESPAELSTAGFFAGLTACLDLPAAALTAGLLVPLLYTRPVQTLLWFVPALLMPVATFFACNYAALGRLTPAYSEFGGPWYEYAGSHWHKLKAVQAGQFVPGIDFAQEPKGVYAFHLLFGHHGWFSLTPAFVVSALGLGMLTWRGRGDVFSLLRRRHQDRAVFTPAVFGPLAIAMSVVLIGFFVVKTNNYGGNTSGPRWLFWLIPLWVLGAVPAADWCARWRTGRLTAALLLGMSVLSVFYPAWNPWRSPWVQQLCERAGWVSYEVPR
ncbi:MAG: hypothetical protein MUF18_07835 [Fimbriiglobus sp.]|nr:hypothetical protein [Fimbriiglobus sp.]